MIKFHSDFNDPTVNATTRSNGKNKPTINTKANDSIDIGGKKTPTVRVDKSDSSNNGRKNNYQIIIIVVCALVAFCIGGVIGIIIYKRKIR